MTVLRLPTLYEVWSVPGCGVRALLDCALEVCEVEIVAAHPALELGFASATARSATLPRENLAAKAVLALVRDLRTALHVYEVELYASEEPERPPDDADPAETDIPF